MKILVIVDVQNDFVNGSLGTKEAQAIIPNIVNKLKTEKYNYIFCTFDSHDNRYLKTKEGEKLPISHCVEWTDGWELNPEVKSVLPKGTINVRKRTFGSNDLVTEIDELVGTVYGDVIIELIGLCTDICVIANAVLLKTAFYDRADIVVDASCCAGVTPEKHKAALEVMKSLQIDIIND